MTDLLDKNNRHLFLEKMNNIHNSFIANINLLASNYKTLQSVEGLFTPEEIEALVALSKLHLQALIDDLNKGTDHGRRKLDIDLLKNYKDYDDTLTDEEKRQLWSDPTKQVYYKGITVYLNCTSIHKDFTELVNNHHKLYDQLRDWTDFNALCGNTTYNVVPNTPIYNHELLRILDNCHLDGSEIERIVLHQALEGSCPQYDAVYVGSKSHNPEYSWADSTSAMEILVSDIDKISRLISRLKCIDNLCFNLDNLLEIHKNLTKLVNVDGTSIWEHLEGLIEIYKNLNLILDRYFDVKEALDKKADKIEKEVVTVYQHFADGRIDSNCSIGFKVGDELFSSKFTLTVTETNEYGKILDGILRPDVLEEDCSGIHEFRYPHTCNVANILVTTKPIGYVKKYQNLVDVRDELLGIIDDRTFVSSRPIVVSRIQEGVATRGDKITTPTYRPRLDSLRVFYEGLLLTKDINYLEVVPSEGKDSTQIVVLFDIEDGAVWEFHSYYHEPKEGDCCCSCDCGDNGLVWDPSGDLVFDPEEGDDIDDPTFTPGEGGEGGGDDLEWDFSRKKKK